MDFFCDGESKTKVSESWMLGTIVRKNYYFKLVSSDESFHSKKLF